MQTTAADWAGWPAVRCHRQAGCVHQLIQHQRRRAVHVVAEVEHCETVDERLHQLIRLGWLLRLDRRARKGAAVGGGWLRAEGGAREELK